MKHISENNELQKLPEVLIDSEHESEYLADEILHKPISSSELLNAVDDAVVKQTGNSEQVLKPIHSEALIAQCLLGINVLVVDDSDINLLLVEQILIKNGATVTTLDSGQAALDQLSLKPDAFDIILMDIQMPEMDGLETTQLIRQQLGLNALPIVAITAGSLVQEKKRALVSGMNAFLTKPIGPLRLISTMHKLVGSNRCRVINVERLTSSSDGIPDNWPVISGIKDNMDLLNGDLVLFVSILERLLLEYQYLEVYSEVDIINTKITFDRLTLAGQMHKLRGSAGVIGAQELYQLAGDAEIALRSDVSEVNTLLKRLAESLTNLRLNSAAFLFQQQNITDKHVETNIQNALSINFDEMKILINGLEKQELSALTIVKEYTGSLRFMLGEKKFKEFEVMLKNLNFKQALTLLNSTVWVFEEVHE